MPKLSDVGKATVSFFFPSDMILKVISLNSTTTHSLPRSQVGDQQLKLALPDIDMCLFMSSHLEMLPQQVEIFVSLVSISTILQTGADTKTLEKVKAHIQAKFKDGLPPHLLPSAKNMTYIPRSDQSRIFVASNSEFLSLPAKDVQSILQKRVILVHGNTFDHNYVWDLESFGQLYDVNKKVMVQGETAVPSA